MIDVKEYCLGASVKRKRCFECLITGSVDESKYCYEAPVKEEEAVEKVVTGKKRVAEFCKINNLGDCRRQRKVGCGGCPDRIGELL